MSLCIHHTHLAKLQAWMNSPIHLHEFGKLNLARENHTSWETSLYTYNFNALCSIKYIYIYTYRYKCIHTHTQSKINLLSHPLEWYFIPSPLSLNLLLHPYTSRSYLIILHQLYPSEKLESSGKNSLILHLHSSVSSLSALLEQRRKCVASITVQLLLELDAWWALDAFPSLSLSQVALPHLSPIHPKSSIFSLFDGLFSSAHKHDWLSFLPESPSLLPSPLSNYCPFLCIPSQLNVSQDSCFHIYLYCFIFDQASKVSNWVSYHLIKTCCVKVTINLHKVKFNGPFVFSSYALSVALAPGDHTFVWQYTIDFLPTTDVSDNFFSVALLRPSSNV